MSDGAKIVERACQLIGRGAAGRAGAVLEREYPFSPIEPTRRKQAPAAALRVFRRDGFVDRYSGDRLIFPGVLRLLSHKLPEEFPYHPNWKTSATHPAYWELYPTVDHVRPVSRGGTDASENWVTTSMLRNSAKAHWTLEELGWALHPAGDRAEWDGLEGWFLTQVERNLELKGDAGVQAWYRAARSS